MTSMRRLAPAALILALAAATPALAGFTPISQPDASYVSGTTLLPVVGADFDAVFSVSGGNVTIDFDVPTVALTAPDSWFSWGSPPDTEGATPRVLWSDGFTSLTLTSSKPLTTFGLEAQPNTDVVSPITATFFRGATQVGEVALDVDGNGGARLFAGTSTSAFDRVVLTSADDFAVAQIRATAVPEPGAIAYAAAIGLGGIVARWRSRRRW